MMTGEDNASPAPARRRSFNISLYLSTSTKLIRHPTLINLSLTVVPTIFTHSTLLTISLPLTTKTTKTLGKQQNPESQRAGWLIDLENLLDCSWHLTRNSRLHLGNRQQPLGFFDSPDVYDTTLRPAFLLPRCILSDARYAFFFVSCSWHIPFDTTSPIFPSFPQASRGVDLRHLRFFFITFERDARWSVPFLAAAQHAPPLVWDIPPTPSGLLRQRTVEDLRKKGGMRVPKRLDWKENQEGGFFGRTKQGIMTCTLGYVCVCSTGGLPG